MQSAVTTPTERKEFVFHPRSRAAKDALHIPEQWFRIPPEQAEHWAPIQAAKDALHIPTQGFRDQPGQVEHWVPIPSSQEHCNLWSGHFRGELASSGRHPRVPESGCH